MHQRTGLTPVGRTSKIGADRPRGDVHQVQQTMQQWRFRRASTAEDKAQVVELCQRGDRSIPEVAQDLDLTESSVRRWMEQIEIDAGHRPGLTSSEHEELVRLRKESRVLREERDILKRAAAFFAKETR
jgi:transposase